MTSDLARWRAEHCPGLMGEASSLYDAIRAASAVADTMCSVLIGGETGTGKELIARGIHSASRRRGPFVAVNCAAIPGELFESEMFGHVRGAFTGADHRRGRFELAAGGTLFLDELGDLPLEHQAKLLRALQEQEFTPVGSMRVCKADVRVLAGTHRDLQAMSAAGQFRVDLLHRVDVGRVQMPALRDRVSDVEVLADAFVERFAREHKRAVTGISKTARDRLRGRRWSGNVRELRNVIEAAVLTRGSGEIVSADLREDLQAKPVMKATSKPLPTYLDDIERDIIAQAMHRSGGNRAEAARLLGLTRTTLLFRLKKLLPELYVPNPPELLEPAE